MKRGLGAFLVVSAIFVLFSGCAIRIHQERHTKSYFTEDMLRGEVIESSLSHLWNGYAIKIRTGFSSKIIDHPRSYCHVMVKVPVGHMDSEFSGKKIIAFGRFRVVDVKTFLERYRFLEKKYGDDALNKSESREYNEMRRVAAAAEIYPDTDPTKKSLCDISMQL